MKYLLIFFIALSLQADIYPEKDWVKGGVVVGISLEGNCVFKPFIKTGDTNDNDDGKPQILGYSPGNVQVDKQGRVIWERVDEDKFVPLNRVKSVNGRHCKCPSFNE